jgi:periplasmic protein TonB
MNRIWCSEPTATPVVRSILVPPDIVAVKRTSPLRPKRRTPWHDRPAGHAIERGGSREWLSDHAAAAPRRRILRVTCGTSLTAHVSGAFLVIIGVWAAPDRLPAVRFTPSLVMPVLFSVPAPAAPESTPGEAQRSRRPIETRRLDAHPMAAPPPPAPIEAPSVISPETGAEQPVDALATSGDRAGATNEAGIGGGPGREAGGAGGHGPGGPAARRLGAGMEPPRKIKDVKPTYPPGALAERALGTVVVDATIGIDGTVLDVVVVRSVPALDRSAIEAVRQWRFLPARFNGEPIAVVVTVVVNFAIY